ncbi:hypothetical protein DKT77_05735 [Meridianimarinicoccus roseus]|uniref:Uncharacterized protein n=1 Tax=Meridianimarinicoccus roseus TaxID=2072018 RepID=A0A2V2LI06_9RHOB|nr:hypothetical protein [Meridianimarinicoccus roseus]PWR03641.1 hypothetical protein DKT77_05735 [Meridianimarinicoccus roseus]
MILIAPNTVWNPRALETRRVPRKLLGRVAILPRQRLPVRIWARLVVEGQFLRFSLALSPFVAAMFIWPESALPISQAPLAMLLVIGVVEMKLLRVPRDRRDEVVDAATADRTLDTLRFRARRVLGRIAARRGLDRGAMHLVVEQSELARIAPLTLVSLQAEPGVGAPQAAVLTPDPEERAWLAGLFDDTLTERDLHLANQRADLFLRDIAFEAQTVSAHSRLAALMDAAPA